MRHQRISNVRFRLLESEEMDEPAGAWDIALCCIILAVVTTAVILILMYGGS